MAKIYRINERRKVRVDDLEIMISPLTLDQKAEISEAVGDGMSTAKLLRGSALAVKYALKDVKGLEESDGTAYELVFESDGSLSEDTITELFNIENSDKLNAICLNLINNMPREFTSPITGEPIEGVEFIVEKEAPRKKKRAASSK